MGLFDVFGNGKKKAEEEEARLLKERQVKEHDEAVARAREAHANLHWPTIPRINRMNTKDAESVKIEDPITAERKDEIGALIYEPKITAEDVKALDLQELMFLLATHLLYNREAALENYEANHRIIYNELLGRIHSAAEFYIIYDRKSGYPLIDGGCINVYLDKEHAEQASAVYNTQFRQTAVVTRPGENAAPLENGKQPVALFDYLYYIGAENVMIDNGWYKAPIKRSEISAPPMSFNADPKQTPPTNPALAFAMTDFVQEIAWQVKYDKRDEIIKAKQARMFATLVNAKFLVPTTVITHDDPESVAQGKRQEVKFPVLNIKDKRFLPVFTDLFEYSKNLKDTAEYKPASFELKNLVKLLGGVDGIIVNCNGQKLIVTKEKAAEIVQGKTESK